MSTDDRTRPIVDARRVAPRRLDSATLGVTFRRVIRSEWVTFRSLRSNWLAVGSSALSLMVIGVIAAMEYAPGSAEGGTFENADTVGLSGILLAQIVIAIMGALAITSEFASGMIRSTFAAVPTRLPVLGAKAFVLAGVTFAVVLPTMIATFFLGQALVGGPRGSLTDDGVARTILGSALYMAVVALLGLGLGTILRQAAGAIGVVLVLLLLAPELLGLVLSDRAEDTFVRYLPSPAGAAVMTIDADSRLLSPVMGGIVLIGWAVGLLGTSAVLLKRRDA